MHQPSKLASKSANSSFKSSAKGFTLIELMIAVAFIGGLLVAITLVILQIMSLYNKGLTLKEVDSVSRIVVRDMQQSIAASSRFSISYTETEAGGVETIKTAKTLAEASANNADYYNNVAGGRLCTGDYSYIWNTGQAIKATNAHVDPDDGDLQPANASYSNPDGSDPTNYPIQILKINQPDGSTDDKIIRFVKTRDAAKAMCRLPAGETASTTEFDRIVGDDDDFINVLGSGDNNLQLYKFSITSPDFSRYGDFEGSQITALATFYNISLSIGTQMGDEASEGLISTQHASCEAPADAQVNNSEYCAVNIIDFVARTGSISR